MKAEDIHKTLDTEALLKIVVEDGDVERRFIAANRLRRLMSDLENSNIERINKISLIKRYGK